MGSLATRRSTMTLRSRTISPSLTEGSLFYTEKGRSVCRILSVVRQRRAGDKPGKDLVRITYRTLRKEEVPEGAAIAPWPGTRNPPKRKVSDETKIVSRAATVRPKAGFINKRPNFIPRAGDDEDQLVPVMMTLPVVGHDGQTIRGPLARPASWPDPEDTNVTRRTPKMVRGMTRVDPIERLMARNSLFEAKHVMAADCYRLAWEQGPGRGPVGSRYGEPKTYVPGPSAGPSDDRVAKQIAWNKIQDYIAEPHAKDVLAHVVLSRGTIKAWAAKRKADPKLATGYLLSVLDRLVLYFTDDIELRLRVDKLHIA